MQNPSCGDHKEDENQDEESNGSRGISPFSWQKNGRGQADIILRGKVQNFVSVLMDWNPLRWQLVDQLFTTIYSFWQPLNNKDANLFKRVKASS